MQQEFRIEVAVSTDVFRAFLEACKNVPSGRGAESGR